MPFRVTFSAPVTYQPGHPKAERLVTALDVSAPTAEGAKMHAIRTTQGDAEIVSVVDITEIPVPLVPPVNADVECLIHLMEEVGTRITTRIA